MSPLMLARPLYSETWTRNMCLALSTAPSFIAGELQACSCASPDLAVFLTFCWPSPKSQVGLVLLFNICVLRLFCTSCFNGYGRCISSLVLAACCPNLDCVHILVQQVSLVGCWSFGCREAGLLMRPVFIDLRMPPPPPPNLSCVGLGCM